MEVFFPPYYDSFQCLAGDCPDSCCKDWIVDIDAASAAVYRRLEGPLGDRLRQVLTDTPDGTVMTIENGRCPMWRDDGLCRIQAELGHDALCDTCRTFPRLSHDYGSFMELGLELSCPEAARLILTASGDFLMQTQPGGQPPEYETDTMELLRQSRNAALRFLQSTPDLAKALAAILLYSHEIQAALDSETGTCSVPDLRSVQVYAHGPSGDLGALFALFRSLEILTPKWQEYLDSNPVQIKWDDLLRNFVRYFFQRYWLQAISDYDLVSRVKLAIAACLLVGALPGDRMEIAQLFSKEIENNPDNLEAILDHAYTSPALTDVNLLALLLG